MAASIMVLRVIEQEFGFKTTERVDVTLGHSLGEFAALVAGGYLRYADALRMVRKRAEVMARCSREAVDPSLSAADIVRRMDHPDVRYIPALADAAKTLIARLKPGDVLLTLGAGDGYVVGQQVLEALGGV